MAAIEPIQDRIVEVGGSHAQREVFHDTLLESYPRLGAHEPAEGLPLTRLEHRPSASRCWLRLGRVHHATGRADEARMAVARALAHWDGADATAPEVAAARAFAV